MSVEGWKIALLACVTLFKIVHLDKNSAHLFKIVHRDKSSPHLFPTSNPQFSSFTCMPYNNNNTKTIEEYSKAL